MGRMLAPQTVENEPTTPVEEKPLHIKFHFHPHQPMVAKAQGDGDTKSRYLYGITSGPRIDGHGERMTADCIKDFMSQAQSGDVLLYPSVHGIRDIDDIGRLVDCEINKDGDWVTTYRLYGPEDGVGQATLDKCDKLWKQINGLAPYTKARQKGFSIEGNVRPGGIVYQSAAGQRVLNAIDLDGVVVVPRPAYKDSMAHAVYKALGEAPPWQVQKTMQKTLQQKLQIEDLENQYYRQKYKLHDALQDEIMTIMTSADANKQAALSGVFDEYKQLMIELIVQSAPWFVQQAQIGTEAKANVMRAAPTGGGVFDALKACVPALQAMVSGNVEMAALPEGTVRQRADGSYKKTNGEWVKVPSTDSQQTSQDTGPAPTPNKKAMDKVDNILGQIEGSPIADKLESNIRGLFRAGGIQISDRVLDEATTFSQIYKYSMDGATPQQQEKIKFLANKIITAMSGVNIDKVKAKLNKQP